MRVAGVETTLVGCIYAVLVLVMTSGCDASENVEQEGAVALVNGKAILRADVRARIDYYRVLGEEVQPREVLEELVDEALVFQTGLERSLPTQTQVLAQRTLYWLETQNNAPSEAQLAAAGKDVSTVRTAKRDLDSVFVRRTTGHHTACEPTDALWQQFVSVNCQHQGACELGDFVDTYAKAADGSRLSWRRELLRNVEQKGDHRFSATDLEKIFAVAIGGVVPEGVSLGVGCVYIKVLSEVPSAARSAEEISRERRALATTRMRNDALGTLLKRLQQEYEVVPSRAGMRTLETAPFRPVHDSAGSASRSTP